MKSLILSFLIVLTLFACSKDDTNESNNQFSLTGTFFAPNGIDPIPNARIAAYQDGEIKSETRTDAKGDYVLSIDEGEYTIILNKGKFKTERNINVEGDFDLNNISIETLPNIAVVTGFYDNIESVLYSIGLVNPATQEPLFDIIEGINILDRQGINLDSGHGHNHGALNRNSSDPLLAPNVDFDFGALLNDEALLDSYDIVFLNCGLSEAYTQNSDALETYVANGGILYATDWAASYLEAITNSGADYITPYIPEKSGISTSTIAAILDGGLSDWLLLNYDISIDDTVEIDDFLGSWQVIDSYDSNTAISWLNGPVTYYDDSNTEISENKDLAFTFLHGEGGVLYSSFHTENSDINDVTQVERVMQFLVFEMSDLQ